MFAAIMPDKPDGPQTLPPKIVNGGMQPRLNIDERSL
jgi:hypothetical protein